MKTAKDWADELLPNRSDAYKAAFIYAFTKIQSDAQKHGEQIGWYRGMTEAANIISNDRKALKSLSDVQAILTARDNKKEI